jgi:hypothetical protein
MIVLGMLVIPYRNETTKLKSFQKSLFVRGVLSVVPECLNPPKTDSLPLFVHQPEKNSK